MAALRIRCGRIKFEVFVGHPTANPSGRRKCHTGKFGIRRTWVDWVGAQGTGGPGSGDGTCDWGAIGAVRKLTRAVSRAAKEEGGLTVSRVADGSRKTRQNH